MKNIILIRAASFGIRSIPPYGPLLLRSYLRKHGFCAYVYDREASRDNGLLKRFLIRHDPDMIGVSAMTCQYDDAKHLMRKIRLWFGKKVKIVAGGVHFTALPASGINAGADYVIRGEGEIALVKLMSGDFTEKNDIIQGELLQRLDDIPLIEPDDIKPFIYKESFSLKGFYTVLTGRGCPYACNFCLGSDQRSRIIRYHSIKYIVELIKSINKEFKINSFFIPDDVFVIQSSRVIEFCNLVSSNIPMPLNFHCFVHPGHGNSKLYKIMKKAGFHRISMGVEHGNDRVLELAGRKTTKEIIERTCSQIYEAGIDLNLTYILGNITETEETIRETVDFAIYLHKRYKASSWFSYMQPLPGSPLYSVAEKYGRYLTEGHNYQNINPYYLPVGVHVGYMIKERKRGMRQANFKPKASSVIKNTISRMFTFGPLFGRKPYS